MSACACGRNVSTGGYLCDRCAALLLLGVAPDATEAEVKDAYRTLAKVWHPDRFQTDPDLRLKAEEKIKEINAAYQLLTTTPVAEPATRNANATAPSEAPSTARPDASDVTPIPAMRRRRKFPLATAFAVLLIGGAWIALRYGRPAASPSTNSMIPVGEGTHTQIAESHPLPAKETLPSTTTQQNEGINESTRSIQRAGVRPHAKQPASSLLVYPPEDPQVPYFTVGSTKDDVVRVQGKPTRITDNLFAYGLSEVYFKDGRVESWRIDPGSPLKARMPEP